MRKCSVLGWVLVFSFISFFSLKQYTSAESNDLIDEGSLPGYLPGIEEDVRGVGKSSTDPPGYDGEIQVIIVHSDAYTPPDQDWSIVHQDTQEFTDSQTGVQRVVTTVIREQPVGGSAQEENEVCQQIFSGGEERSLESRGDVVTQADCSYVATHTRETTEILSYKGAKLEHHLKSWGKLYHGPRGNYYKLTSIRVWWKRTSTKWTVKKATFAFGCPVICEKCDSKEYKGKRSGSIGTPLWKDNYNSAAYIIPGNFPELWNGVSCEIGGAPMAGSASYGYYSGVKKGTLMPSICWN